MYLNHTSAAKCFPDQVAVSRYDPCVQIGEPDAKGKSFFKSILRPLKAMNAEEISDRGTFSWKRKWRYAADRAG